MGVNKAIAVSKALLADFLAFRDAAVYLGVIIITHWNEGLKPRSQEGGDAEDKEARM